MTRTAMTVVQTSGTEPSPGARLRPGLPTHAKAVRSTPASAHPSAWPGPAPAAERTADRPCAAGHARANLIPSVASRSR